MSNVVNDRDVLLATTVSRINAGGVGVIVVPSSPTIKFATDGTPNPSTVTFTATKLSVAGNLTWSIVGGTLTGTDPNVRTLTAANMTADSATVTVKVTYGGVEHSNSTTVHKVRDGVVSYTWIKYADTATGTGLSDDPTGKTYIGLAHNKNTSVESTNPADYAWSLIKGTDGVPGDKGADGTTFYTWIKYSDNADGTGLYDVPTANTVYIGIATNKTTATESTVKTDYVWSRFRGSDGVAGANGTNGSRGAGHYYATGSAWSNALADAVTPGGNVLDDVVTISNGTNFVMEKKWNGSAWVDMGVVIDGNLIVTNSITSSKIDTRGLSIKDASGNVILAAGNALNPAYAAPGTKNSEQTLPALGLNTYRVVAYGGSASATVPVTPGFWINGVHYASPGRSYNLLILARSDLSIALHRIYDVYGEGVNTGGQKAIHLAADLNYFSDPGRAGHYIIVLWTHDEPQGHRFDDGLAAAMYRNGASRAIFGSPEFQYRSAYCMISISGCGEGSGAEFYQGSVSADPNAWVDVTFTMRNGELASVSPAHTPRSLRDYAYTGDYDATKGAPAGTYVGDTEAQAVVGWAYSGFEANNAIPGINSAIADKLSKTAASILQAPITITTSGGVVVGSLTYNPTNGLRTGGSGVAMTPYGILGHNGSKYTFAVSAADGSASFGGTLDAPSGTFGALRIASGGYIAQGAYTGSWAWPSASEGGGFLIHPNGMLFGNANNPSIGFIYIDAANGRMAMPGFDYNARQLTLDQPVIINPKQQTSFSATMASLTQNGLANTSTYASYSFKPTLSNGVAPYSYFYVFSLDEGDMKMTSSPTPSDGWAVIQSRGSNRQSRGYLTVTVTDANGAKATTSCSISLGYGAF